MRVFVGETDRRTDGRTDRQTDKETERERERERERECVCPCVRVSGDCVTVDDECLYCVQTAGKTGGGGKSISHSRAAVSRPSRTRPYHHC